MITLYRVVSVDRYEDEADGFVTVARESTWETPEAAEKERKELANTLKGKLEVYIQPITLYESEEEMKK